MGAGRAKEIAMVNDNASPPRRPAHVRLLAESAGLNAAAKLADHPRRARTRRREAKLARAAAAAIRPLARPRETPPA